MQKVQSEKPSVLFISGKPYSVGHVFRVEHAVEALNFTGWQARWCTSGDHSLISLLERSNLVVVFRELWNNAFQSIYQFCHHKSIPLVYDIDDLIFRQEYMNEKYFAYLKRLPDHQKSSWAENARLYQKALEHCDAALLTTKPLAEAASRHCKEVFIFPNTLNKEMEQNAEQAHSKIKPSSIDGRLRIGFASGTPTHQRDFKAVAQALAPILQSRKEIILVIAGELNVSEFPELMDVKDQLEFRPRVPVSVLFSEFSRFDINLAPLETENPICEAKSELRYVFGSSVGIPTVASPTIPIQNTITDRHNGLLAADQNDWKMAIECLVENPELRKKIGEEARKTVIRRFGWEAKVELTRNVFRIWQRG